MRDSRTHLNFDQSMRESSFEHTFANQPNPRAEVSFNPVTRRVAPLYARRETSASVFWRPVRRDSTPRPSVGPRWRALRPRPKPVFILCSIICAALPSAQPSQSERKKCRRSMGNVNETTMTPPPSPEVIPKMPKLAEFQVTNMFF